MFKKSPFCFLVIAVLLLIVQGCRKEQQSLNDFISGSVEKVSVDSLRSYAQWLQDMGTRFYLADNHRQVAVKIKQRFIKFGYPETVLDSFQITTNFNGNSYTTWQYNVVATLEGSEDSICILGAHYDDIAYSVDPFTYAPGANDNASGVSAMLEIARLIHKTSFKPKYTIRFIAFAAEEAGLYGSYVYAMKAEQRGDKIMMMLNNDMISVLVSPQTKPWYVNIIDYNHPTLLADAEAAGSSFTSLSSSNDYTHWMQSDSYPFYIYGFKALFFIEPTIDGNYHTANDLVTACSYEYCREVTKINYALLLEKNRK
jgi:hypothetical protein